MNTWNGIGRQPTEWRLAHGRSLTLGPRALLMGILNVTPDSFSDGGRFLDAAASLAQARRMIGEGADIVDIGGESTRPGARAIEEAEEQDRVLPVVEAVAAAGAIVSIDTYRASTAKLAVEAGAHIVNDVWGLQKDMELAAVAAASRAGLVIMHTGRERERLPDPVADQHAFLSRSLRIADEAGIEHDRIVLDPGFGFAKDTEDNLELMSRLPELRQLGCPLLVGTSRKRFVGAVTGRDGDERDAGTAATGAILRLRGADIFRVHNVAVNKDALAIADAVLARETGREKPPQGTAKKD